MSDARIPPPAGGTTKIVFAGVEPGSEEARALFQEYHGPIGHFHRKARQQQELSENPTLAIHQPLPDGVGAMRYSMNNGQEMIHVRLSRYRTSGQPKPVKGEVVKPKQRIVAIDIIQDPVNYKSSDYDLNTFQIPPGDFVFAQHSLLQPWDNAVPIAVRRVSKAGTSTDVSNVLTADTPNPKLFYAGNPAKPVTTNAALQPFVYVPWAPSGLSFGTAGGGFGALMDPGGAATFEVYAASESVQYLGTCNSDIGVSSVFTPAPIALPTARLRFQARELSTGAQAVTGYSTFQGHERADFADGSSFDDLVDFGIGHFPFLVERNFKPGGGELADPKQKGMGALLAHTDIATYTLAGYPFPDDTGAVPGILPPTFPIAMPGGIGAMTLVAKITVSVPLDPAHPSVVKIKPVV